MWFPPATMRAISPSREGSSFSSPGEEEEEEKRQRVGRETSSTWPMPSWPEELEPREKSVRGMVCWLFAFVFFPSLMRAFFSPSSFLFWFSFQLRSDQCISAYMHMPVLRAGR